VKGTLDFFIFYHRREDLRLCEYTDSNWEGSLDDRKSTFGYIFRFCTGAVTWTSGTRGKQHVVALSSTKAKYQGAVKGTCDTVRLRSMLSYMKMQYTTPRPLFCDN
jgi:hypothetical protein